jgi:alkylhydroperoxidase/carboxymuconolactone decarboxylase family protein YurZ
MPEKSWSQILTEHSPELAQLLQEDSQFMASDSALPAWIKYLMAMQMDSIFNKPAGVSSYGKKALELGASKAQVVEAIQMVRMFAGRPAMVTAAEALREEID